MKTAADTFRPNPAFDCATVITNLGTGEALVSTLEGKGAPSMVERTLVRPPSGRVGPVTDGERQAIINASPVAGQYDQDVDRQSAYEILTARAQKNAEQDAAKQPEQENAGSRWTLPGFGDDDKASRPRRPTARPLRLPARDDRRSGDEKRGANRRHPGRAGAGARNSRQPETVTGSAGDGIRRWPARAWVGALRLLTRRANGSFVSICNRLILLRRSRSSAQGRG